MNQDNSGRRKSKGMDRPKTSASSLPFYSRVLKVLKCVCVCITTLLLQSSLAHVETGLAHQRAEQHLAAKMLATINGFVLPAALALDSTNKEWEPPIGIPRPEFGITETVESVYGNSGFYTYYTQQLHKP